MPFIVPTFPLEANVWRDSSPLTGPPDLVVDCQLRWAKTLGGGFNYPPFLYPASNPVNPPPMELLVEKGTDIRDGSATVRGDTVECPAGTGRFYRVGYVDDVARGFPNEYRVALLSKRGPSWPTPIP